MRHATNRVKGFYAKTKKPARSNIFVGPALPRRPALCARVTAIHADVVSCMSLGSARFSRAEQNQESSLQSTTHFQQTIERFPRPCYFFLSARPGWRNGRR